MKFTKETRPECNESNYSLKKKGKRIELCRKARNETPFMAKRKFYTKKVKKTEFFVSLAKNPQQKMAKVFTFCMPNYGKKYIE